MKKLRRKPFPTPGPWYMKPGRIESGHLAYYIYAANGHPIAEVLQRRDAVAILKGVNKS